LNGELERMQQELVMHMKDQEKPARFEVIAAL
jgi:hypothetical protein